MKFAKSLLMGTGGLALAGLLLALLAPRAAHGLVAALVQVANTASAPAIASLIDDPGRVAFVQPYSINCSGYTCTFTSPFAVPAGHRVVIQHVSGVLNFDSAPSFVFAQVVPPVYFNVPLGTAGVTIYFDQPILYYFDGGQIPEVVFYSGTPFSANGQNLTLIGYELDCTAAPCAAIANH
ncbi:MAG: hypothetical protein ACLQU1_32460 [Bryobacteraceae bacterium]